jgi:hypothetical protein
MFRLHRVLWFIGLWIAGVATLGVAGYAIKLVLAP